MEVPTGTETSMRIQAPERGVATSSHTEGMTTPVASADHVVVQKP
jgi:general secretion pathway protein D